MDKDYIEQIKKISEYTLKQKEFMDIVIDKGWYSLDENHNVIKTTMMESAMLREKGGWIVKQEKIGDVRISTVFLGLDHSMYTPEGHKPIVFETMIFGGELNEYQTRCSTWDEALKMHQNAVDLVKGIKEWMK